MAVCVAVIALIWCVYLLWASALNKLRIAYASDQIKTFELLRDTALHGTDPVKYLQGIIDHYPSGTKQIAGSRLNSIVETARSNAVREVIAKLRQGTGTNYGDDPAQWIRAARKGANN